MAVVCLFSLDFSTLEDGEPLGRAAAGFHFRHVSLSRSPSEVLSRWTFDIKLISILYHHRGGKYFFENEPQASGHKPSKLAKTMRSEIQRALSIRFHKYGHVFCHRVCQGACQEGIATIGASLVGAQDGHRSHPYSPNGCADLVHRDADTVTYSRNGTQYKIT